MQTPAPVGVQAPAPDTKAHPATQLFCFTHAGGNATFFDDIESDLPDIHFVKLEYAGHGTRHKEAPYADFGELADDLFARCKRAWAGGPFALFGYSMGSISTVEVLRRMLADADMPAPAHVFLAAHEPHTKAELADYRDGESDELVKRRTIDFGTVPDRLANNKTFWRMYLPLYRADYSIIGKYRFEDLDFACEVPATVFYSEQDTPLADMLAWRRHFEGPCDFHRYEGRHFFIQDHHEEMAHVIASALGGLT